MFDPFTQAPGKIAILEQKISGALGVSVDLTEVGIAVLVLFTIHVLFRSSLFETRITRRNK